MDEKSYYLVALFDNKTEARLQGLGKLLLDNGFEGKNMTPNVPYHITLNGPEGAPDAAALARMAEVCRKTPAFEIGLGYIGLFGLDVLFLAPTPCEALIEVRRELLSGLDARPDRWTPHVTMCMDEPEVIARAAPVLAKAFSPTMATVERLAVYEVFPARLVEGWQLTGNG